MTALNILQTYASVLFYRYSRSLGADTLSAGRSSTIPSLVETHIWSVATELERDEASMNSPKFIVHHWKHPDVYASYSSIPYH